MLREDNVIERLYEISRDYGLVLDSQLKRMEAIVNGRADFLSLLLKTKITPNEKIRNVFKEINTPVLQKPINLETLLKRSEINCLDLKKFNIEIPAKIIYEPVEIKVKYSGYINLENDKINQTKKLEKLTIPADFIYNDLVGLSVEEKEKLNLVRPRTLGQATRISGVNPSAIHAIMLYLKSRKRKKIGKGR